jgi:hypothetical protein
MQRSTLPASKRYQARQSYGLRNEWKTLALSEAMRGEPTLPRRTARAQLKRKRATTAHLLQESDSLKREPVFALDLAEGQRITIRLLEPRTQRSVCHFALWPKNKNVLDARSLLPKA